MVISLQAERRKINGLTVVLDWTYGIFSRSLELYFARMTMQKIGQLDRKLLAQAENGGFDFYVAYSPYRNYH
jgi:hypothetical protein